MIRLSMKVRSTMGQVPPLLRSEGERITAQGLKLGEVAAKGAAPVDTGFLRSSIRSRMTGRSVGVLEALADYAVHVHYGTRRMAARPFMDAGTKAAQDYIDREWGNFERKVPSVR